MLKMVWFIFLFQLMFLDLSGARHESAQVLTVVETTHEVPQSSSLPIAVWVRDTTEVSTSVIKAETWLKTHVLTHYLSIPITTVLVGDTILCSKPHNNLSLVLLALKNIHHSLTRWGLEKHIKVSVAFSSGCFDQSSETERFVRPILEFLQGINSTYTVNPPHVIVTNPNEAKPKTRKLTSIPQPITSLHSSVPAIVPKNPLVSPAPSQTASPPVKMTFTYAPKVSPFYHQATPPLLPPCNQRAPGPDMRPVLKLWCVAKPTVPTETLQKAVDYACGAGGADCQEIMPSGNCYHPESVVAHASYAFNSYWQKNKRNGGTCSFGGTAMLINSDPSYQLCRFITT